MRELLSCFSSLSGKLIPKMSPVVSGEILGVFVNTLTADVKYPLQDCENLQLPIQMQLFGKRKKFSQFFVPFLESTSNFKHFEKRIIIIANVYPKLQKVKILLRPHSNKRCYRTRFDSQHVKVSQIFAKFPWVRLYHVFHHSHWIWFAKFVV